MKETVLSPDVKMVVYETKADWRNHRKGIGGSDAGSILGVNHWKNNQELFLEKTGQQKPEDISDKPYVKYGVQAEPLLRSLFALDHPDWVVGYTPDNIWYNQKVPFAHASLDGWITDENGKNGVLEIKTANVFSPAQGNQWKGRIPDTYYAQVVHYLMITGLDFAVVRAQLKYGGDDLYIATKEYRFNREDCEEDIWILHDKEQEFWEHVKRNEMPALILPDI